MADIENAPTDETGHESQTPEAQPAENAVELPQPEPLAEQIEQLAALAEEAAGSAPAQPEPVESLTPAETGALLPEPIEVPQAAPAVDAEAEAVAPIAEGDPSLTGEIAAIADSLDQEAPAGAEVPVEGEAAVDAEAEQVEGAEAQTGETEAAAAQPEEAAAEATGAESLDDIQPSTPAATSVAQVEPLEETSTGFVSWWPFLGYLGAWAALIALAVWQFSQVPEGRPLWGATVYAYTVLGGVAMTAAGVIVLLVAWMVYALRSGASHRGRAFIDSLIKGAIVTFGGVAMWVIALLAMDYWRLGRL